jgi:cysteinyl-tRNA synthetase
LDGLQGARTSLARIDECLGKLRELAGNTQGTPEPELVKAFAAALDEDLNISGAWGVIFEWVRQTNRHLAEQTLTPAQAASALAAWNVIDSVLGVGQSPEAEVPGELTALLEQRVAARKAKDFKRADAIRDELKAKGWVIEDTPKGARLKPI